jgi:hypothetical protein
MVRAMTDDERLRRRALLLGAIAAALGVGLPACGGSAPGKGAASPSASGSAGAAGVSEVHEVRERPMRDAHCGRD